MANTYSYLPYEKTGYFSKLITDYLGKQPAIKEFYTFYCDEAGIADAINKRQDFPVDRKALVEVLTRQYSHLEKATKVTQNINLLLSENTFTVCTAHQPNLLTGYLYFIYKILHAIKLAGRLKELHPDKNFVPVYYMGSEDNDIEELGVFRFRGKKFVWDGSGQKGAVGRMVTTGLLPVLNELFDLLGPPGPDCDRLKKMITQAYLEHSNIGAATQFLVNELFGSFGLVVIDPDDAHLKSLFIPVMEDELLNQYSSPVIVSQVERLERHYKIQAHPREINLFYLNHQLRERIEKKGEKWAVKNTNIEFTKEEICDELHKYPERFSPNVMLRGLFQETILPDVAFIGGGAEVAYWMQLKTLFEKYNVFFPAICLRQSVQVIDRHAAQLQLQLQLEDIDLFKEKNELENEFIMRFSPADLQTDKEVQRIEDILIDLKNKAIAVDNTLGPAAASVLVKIKHQIDIINKKMLRAEKKKMEVQLARISRLDAALFPGGALQERVNNFMEYYLDYGASFLQVIYDGIEPAQNLFQLVKLA